MAIGVFRLYVARALTEAGTLCRLVAALDELPAFLYRIDRIADADIAASSGDPDALRDAARIAMTQAHIAIVDPAHLGGTDRFAQLEMELAHSGFRRRIPVLGLVVSEGGSVPAVMPAGVDRMVGLGVDALLVAIQEMAEQAAAERRAMRERTPDRPLKLVASPTVNLPMQSPEQVPDAPRPLPVFEILASLAEFKAAREQQSRPN